MPADVVKLASIGSDAPAAAIVSVDVETAPPSDVLPTPLTKEAYGWPCGRTRDPFLPKVLLEEKLCVTLWVGVGGEVLKPSAVYRCVRAESRSGR